MIKAFGIAAALCLATTPLATAEETRESLIAQIERAGQNEHDNRRHAVKVDDCQLTTFFWKYIENEGWVLWTSFKIPMLLVDLAEFETQDGSRFFLSVGSEPYLTLIQFEAKEGADFTHEKPHRRESVGETRASSRGDGKTHYLDTVKGGLVMHTGPNVEEKAHLFTTGYIRYVQTYCAYIG